jgi:hypothetical protein
MHVWRWPPVSIEAINWALNKAPIPTDRKDASPLPSVLIGLANHADPDGRNAFPSVDRLTRYTHSPAVADRPPSDSMRHHVAPGATIGVE